MVTLLSFLFFSAWAFSQDVQAAAMTIRSVESHRILIAEGEDNNYLKRKVLAVKSQDIDVGIIGFVRILEVEKRKSGIRLKSELIRNSQFHIIRVGDHLIDFDLSSDVDGYQANTELLVRENAPHISSRFKPLFTQGLAIGETAQTLWKDEFLLSWYGDIHFGVTDWLTIGSILPGDIGGLFPSLWPNVFVNSPNASMKARIWDAQSYSIASGFTFGKTPTNDRWILNWNMMWDSFSNEKTVSHTFATMAIYAFEKSNETTAIKSAGTSSFQTGYEFLMDNWSRVLFGPNYNFETKTIGGYLAYTKIWDHIHLQGTLYTVDVRNVEWSVKEGYFAYVEAYYRF